MRRSLASSLLALLLVVGTAGPAAANPPVPSPSPTPSVEVQPSAGPSADPTVEGVFSRSSAASWGRVCIWRLRSSSRSLTCRQASFSSSGLTTYVPLAWYPALGVPVMSMTEAQPPSNGSATGASTKAHLLAATESIKAQPPVARAIEK